MTSRTRIAGQWVGTLLTLPLVVQAGQLDLDRMPMTSAYVDSDSSEMQMPGSDSHTHNSHSHEPVRMNLRPIVTRMKVALAKPRRVIVDEAGHAIVADFAAGRVVRVNSHGDVTVLAQGLNQPAGLALDRSGNLYISLNAHGVSEEGSILKLTPEGDQTVFADALTGPTDLTFDEAGNLFVANLDSNSISMITPDGVVSTFADHVPEPTAVLVGEAGDLYVLSATEGELLRISCQGTVTHLLRDLPGPSDLTRDAKGNLIISNYGGNSLTWYNFKGQTGSYATVPKGTVSHAFDPEGNLWLVNWEYQFLMKVTTRLTVPCPHCGKPIPLLLQPPRRPQKSADPII